MESYESSIEEEINYRLKVKIRKRLAVALAVALSSILLAAILYFERFSEGEIIFIVLIVILSFVFVIWLLMNYLQAGFKKKYEADVDYVKYDNELKILKNRLENSANISSSDLEFIRSEIFNLKEQASIRESIGGAISAEHKDELVEILRAKIVKESSSQASQDVLLKIKDDVRNENNLKEVESVFSRTLERLYSEINALSRRGNLNLSLGILTTIIGLGILGYFVLEIDSIPEDKMAFIAHFIPRLSLVVLIEVFAYFFLKLYKSSLGEIKYFQNEMTNVEAKLAAIKCSIMTADAVATSAVIQGLSTTERNAVLEKGQTTAEIEKARIEQINISTLSEKISNILGHKKSD